MSIENNTISISITLEITWMMWFVVSNIYILSLCSRSFRIAGAVETQWNAEGEHFFFGPLFVIEPFVYIVWRNAIVK